MKPVAVVDLIDETRNLFEDVGIVSPSDGPTRVSASRIHYPEVDREANKLVREPESRSRSVA
jgi:hypothetical protein